MNPFTGENKNDTNKRFARKHNAAVAKKPDDGVQPTETARFSALARYTPLGAKVERTFGT